MDSRAFTLLELLISLAIIAILLAILIPLLSTLRASAKIAQCAANLHAIGIALHAYQSDHNRFPTAAAMPNPFAIALSYGPPVYIPLAPYIPTTSNVYRCPTDLNQVFIPTATASPTHTGISYTYMGAITPKAEMRGVVLDDLMWDYLGGGSLKIPHPLHQGGANTLRTDGSVYFLPASKVHPSR